MIALAHAAPNLMSLDALMEQVWRKAIVSPETVSQRVKLLRDALGDNPRAPRYIEGLRGRGYRLIPAIEPIAAPPEETAQQGTTIVDANVASAAASDAISGINEIKEKQPPPEPESGSKPLRLYRRSSVGWGALLAATLSLCIFLAWQSSRRSPVQQRASVAAVLIRPRSVAVMPFDNLSTEPNSDYIALGVADTVLHQLASVPELIVVARSSSFAVGKPAPEAREVGRRLGVQYLVNGNVQRAGNVLRVTAELTDATRNVTLWSLKLDRTIDDVFELQDQIAQRVAQQLNVTLQGRSVAYTHFGTDAYLAFLKGRSLIESRRLKDVQEAVSEFSHALALAPAFAAAMSELARAKLQLANLLPNARAQLTLLQPEVESLVARAIEIDPQAGEPLFLRAKFKVERGDSKGADADFRNGLEFSPNFSPGLREYAEYLVANGRDEEALVQLDRAILVDPLSAESRYRKGEVLRTEMLRPEEAASMYVQALSVQPDFYPAYARLATTRWQAGDVAQAIRFAEKGVAIEPRVSWTRARLVWLYVDLGELKAARHVLNEYGSMAAELAVSEALVCYRAGDLKRAATLLEKPLLAPDPNTGGIATIVAIEAFLEESIANRSPAAAMHFIASIPDVPMSGGTLAVVADNFPLVIDVAAIEQAAGNTVAARASAQRSLQYLGSEMHLLLGFDEWSRAAALAILGRNDEALAHLENLAHSGLRIAWWSRVERHPVFTALHGTSRFQALVNSSRSSLQSQMQQIEQMRSTGEVPNRSADGRTVNGC